jgi:hypothetical protein
VATLHSVGNVAGAGYAVSNEVGLASITIKLARVALLSPALIFFNYLVNRHQAKHWREHFNLPLVFMELYGHNCAQLLGAIPFFFPWCDGSTRQSGAYHRYGSHRPEGKFQTALPIGSARHRLWANHVCRPDYHHGCIDVVGIKAYKKARSWNCSVSVDPARAVVEDLPC